MSTLASVGTFGGTAKDLGIRSRLPLDFRIHLFVIRFQLKDGVFNSFGRRMNISLGNHNA